MSSLCSFLHSVCQLVKVLMAPAITVTKQIYRSSAVILSGTVIVAVMTFTSAGFSGGGHNALAAYAETSGGEPETEDVKEEEEIAVLTEARIQLHLTNAESLRSGQLLAGDTLAKGLQQKEAARKERLAVTERTREEIRQVEEEKKRQAEKEAARQAAVVYYSDQDYEVLTRIVGAEAGGCDTKGRILVANVVLNRVKSKEFPNTITDVVYQKSQFSPVFDGRLRTCRVSEKTVEAVNRALEGEDYSQGALYFMNRKHSRSRNVSWFDGSLTFLFQHEKHEFFK